MTLRTAATLIATTMLLSPAGAAAARELPEPPPTHRVTTLDELRAAYQEAATSTEKRLVHNEIQLLRSASHMRVV